MDLPLLTATIAGIGGVLGFLFSRRYLPRDPHKAAMVCGVVVIASSAYTLVTSDAHALTFRVHIGLLVLMSLLLLVRAFRAQRL